MESLSHSQSSTWRPAARYSRLRWRTASCSGWSRPCPPSTPPLPSSYSWPGLASKPWLSISSPPPGKPQSYHSRTPGADFGDDRTARAINSLLLLERLHDSKPGFSQDCSSIYKMGTLRFLTDLNPWEIPEVGEMVQKLSSAHPRSLRGLQFFLTLSSTQELGGHSGLPSGAGV